MGDAVVGQDHVGAAAHDDKVLPLGHVAQQAALVEEHGVLGGQTVVAVELLQALFDAAVLVQAKALVQVLLVGKAHPVLNGLGVGLQPLQHLGKDLGVVVVDLQGVGQGKADVGARAAIGAANAHHQVIPLVKAAVKLKAVQVGHLGVQNVQGVEVGGQLVQGVEDLIVLGHQPGAVRLDGDGAGHVGDQGQLAAEIVALGEVAHQVGQAADRHVPVPVEHPAQAGAQHLIDLRVQIVNTAGNFQPHIHIVIHVIQASLQKEDERVQQEHGTQETDRPQQIAEEGGHANTVFIRDGFYHKVGGVANIGVGAHEHRAAGDGLQHLHGDHA